MHKTSIFIEKARAKHGDRYDYSESRYSSVRDKLKIICVHHGMFEQAADNHLSGHGCRKCATISNRENRLIKHRNIFLRKAASIHGDRYDYSETDYIKAIKKVKIICAEHGEFYQTPNGHLNGHGCNKCAINEMLKSKQEEHKASFVEKARKVHGLLYDYSKTLYIHSKSKVVIRCITHGFFDQTPTNHLCGKGCPRCPKRFSEPVELYILSDGLGKIKIGYSIDIKYRLSKLNSSSPFKSEIIESWTLEDAPTARSAEHKIHKKLIKQNAGLSGFDGATEWFRLSHAKARKAVLEVLHNKNVISHNVAGDMQLKLI